LPPQSVRIISITHVTQGTSIARRPAHALESPRANLPQPTNGGAGDARSGVARTRPRARARGFDTNAVVDAWQAFTDSEKRLVNTLNRLVDVFTQRTAPATTVNNTVNIMQHGGSSVQPQSTGVAAAGAQQMALPLPLLPPSMPQHNAAAAGAVPLSMPLLLYDPVSGAPLLWMPQQGAAVLLLMPQHNAGAGAN
jgi:hypothetical protein